MSLTAKRFFLLATIGAALLVPISWLIGDYYSAAFSGLMSRALLTISI